jgi:hypothetical protein
MLHSLIKDSFSCFYDFVNKIFGFLVSQDKFTYTGIVSGDEFMSNLAILGEKRFHPERKLKQTLPYHKEMQKK